MHAHERTYLAKLGFSDPDLREPIHDLACQYMKTQPTLERLARFLGIEHGPQSRCFELPKTRYKTEQESHVSKVITSYSTQLEREITKGHNQYKTTVGFIDFCVKIDTEEQHTSVRRRQLNGRYSWLGSGLHDQECAEVFGKAVEHLIPDNLTPQAVIEVAKPESSPIHNMFRWFEGEIGHRFLSSQAEGFIERLQINKDYSPDWKNIADYSTPCDSTVHCIEVKVTPVTICELLRQINIYKSYSQFQSWIVATTYSLSVADLKCLTDENLKHIYLGQHFQTYLAEQKNGNHAESSEI